MKRFIVSAVGIAVLTGHSVGAQAGKCVVTSAATLFTQDACQKAVDLYQYMAPQLGSAISGGNATLGQGGSLGGIGHFSVGLRVNVIAGSVPQLNDKSSQPVITGARSSNYPTKDTPLPMPAVEAAIGIFKGIPLGLTNVGGIDLIVSASYIPKIDKDSLSVHPDNPLKLGYGARLGLLQESLVVPGISVSYLKRDLPVIALTGTASGSSLIVSDLSEKTTAWRAVASKSLIVFGLAAGYGQDKYESSATASATTSGQTSGNVSVAQSLTRSNLFADLSVNLLALKIIGEVGQVSGGTAPSSLNTFQGKGIVDSRLYGSVGLRFGW